MSTITVQFKDVLEKNINCPNKDLVIECLSNIMCDYDQDLMINALLGCKGESSYTLYETYLIGYDYLSTYGCNKTFSIQKGFVDSNNLVKCKLIQFNPWKEYAYKVEYTLMDDNNKEIIKHFNAYDNLLRQLEEEFP